MCLIHHWPFYCTSYQVQVKLNSAFDEAMCWMWSGEPTRRGQAARNEGSCFSGFQASRVLEELSCLKVGKINSKVYIEQDVLWNNTKCMSKSLEGSGRFFHTSTEFQFHETSKLCSNSKLPLLTNHKWAIEMDWRSKTCYEDIGVTWRRPRR